MLAVDCGDSQGISFLGPGEKKKQETAVNQGASACGNEQIRQEEEEEKRRLV